MKALTQKASLNALAGGLDYGARMVTAFVVTPLLIHGLGSSLYGVWLVLGRLTGHLTAAGGRSTQALKLILARHQSSDDFEQKRRDVGSAVCVWLIFFPLLVALGVAVAWWAPRWLGVSAEAVGIVRWAGALLAVRMVLNTLLDLPQSVLEGENLGYKRMGLSALLIVAGGGMTILALRTGAGLVGVAAAATITILLTGLLFLLLVRRHVPWFGVARPAPGAVRRFLGLSWWFLLWRVVAQTMMTGDVVVLGIAASASSVTAYSVSRYVPETLINVIAIVDFGIAPGLGGIIGAGDLDRARRVRGEIMLLTWLAITSVGLTTLLWNRQFVSLWVGQEHYVGFFPMLLILVMVGQLILIRNDANVIDLTLDVKRKVMLGVLSLAMSIGLSVFLVRALEDKVVGLCVGFIAGRSILTLAYPALVARSLRLALPSQLGALVRPAAVTLLLLAVAPLAVDLLRTSSWLGLIFGTMTTLTLSGSVAFYGGFSVDQRSRALQRVQIAMSGRRN